MQEQTKNHRLIIDNKKSVEMTGVESVLSFNDTKIVLALVGGGKVTATGSGLKIVGFSKADGTFLATGEIAGVAYGAKSLMQKFFR
ncbi:MAG: YabP/YqfC family sporulation protein [Clostridia bacterium]|nr:YabP/YqfC family sporulation protein [Clostridia bacterium]